MAAPAVVDYKLQETAGSYVYRFTLGGFQKDDLDVVLNNSREIIVRSIRPWAPLEKVLRLPAAASLDYFHTRFEAGVLTVTVPKRADAPPVDPNLVWAEKAGSYVRRLTLTGFWKDDIRVQVDGAGRLIVRGTRPGASLHKVFQLPAAASLDDIDARFKAGVLTLTVPVDPNFEWVEKAGSYVLRLTLTGFQKDDFRVQVGDSGRLTVRGTRPDASPHRVFQLPAAASLDDIASHLEAGVLTLTVRKRADAPPPVDPNFEWVEKAGSYVLRLTLTGFQKDDLRATLDRAGRLTVRGTRPDASLHRVFQLPSTPSPDDIKGSLNDGVLTLTVRKRAAFDDAGAMALTSIEEIKSNKPGPLKMVPTEQIYYIQLEEAKTYPAPIWCPEAGAYMVFSGMDTQVDTLPKEGPQCPYGDDLIQYAYDYDRMPWLP